MTVGRTFILALLKLADLLAGLRSLHGRLRLIIADRAARPVSTRTEPITLSHIVLRPPWKHPRSRWLIDNSAGTAGNVEMGSRRLPTVAHRCSRC
ncbi:MAG: hypothetical protein A3F68_13660 [Acidobacteria bacterium RIFCSPLOWO2_12_FULL_54_10]|nr:MAG: hypothetical protein A3F68_13660 [Acidobacteria bacterium RIFCSPLOWO2_12_FULL_54_10]